MQIDVDKCLVAQIHMSQISALCKEAVKVHREAVVFPAPRLKRNLLYRV